MPDVNEGNEITASADSRRRVWWHLMEWGANIGCHQMPERSFFFRGYQFPVCARCTGVLLSTPPAMAVFFLHRMSIALSLGLSSIMLLDWSLQYFGIRESTNPRRLVTGFIGGFGVTMLHMYFYYGIYLGVVAFVKMVCNFFGTSA